MKPHRGTLILVFGMVGVCWPLGIVAWIMGSGDLKQMDAGAMDPSGRSTTNAGRIIGLISTILGIIVLVITLVAVVFLGVFSMHQAR